MRILFLYSRPRIDQAKAVENGTGHDNQFIGMYRLRKYGFTTSFLDPEHVLGNWLGRQWRKVLNIWWMHVPFYPYFWLYDVVFAGGAYGSLLIKALLHLPRPKWIIYDANIAGTIGKADTLRTKMFRYAVSHADGIVTLSQVEEDTLREMFPHMAPHIQFLHEGVDTSYFIPGSESEQNFILSVGIDPGRDFATIIDAVRGENIELKIATKPERVAHIELPQNVSARFYAHDELKKLYASAKAIVIGLNSKEDSNDSMGTYAVIEAMASGKVVIATETKALKSYIHDGTNGFFVPVHDVRAMRNTIRKVCDDAAIRKEVGARAREFAVTHCDAEVYAKKLAQFLSTLKD